MLSCSYILSSLNETGFTHWSLNIDTYQMVKNRVKRTSSRNQQQCVQMQKGCLSCETKLSTCKWKIRIEKLIKQNKNSQAKNIPWCEVMSDHNSGDLRAII